MTQVYGEEFRREAVRLARSSGLSRDRIAADLGIGKSTLAKWIQLDSKLANQGSGTGLGGHPANPGFHEAPRTDRRSWIARWRIGDPVRSESYAQEPLADRRASRFKSVFRPDEPIHQ